MIRVRKPLNVRKCVERGLNDWKKGMVSDMSRRMMVMGTDQEARPNEATNRKLERVFRYGSFTVRDLNNN